MGTQEVSLKPACLWPGVPLPAKGRCLRLSMRGGMVSRAECSPRIERKDSRAHLLCLLSLPRSTLAPQGVRGAHHSLERPLLIWAIPRGQFKLGALSRQCIPPKEVILWRVGRCIPRDPVSPALQVGHLLQQVSPHGELPPMFCGPLASKGKGKAIVIHLLPLGPGRQVAPCPVTNVLLSTGPL